MVPGPGDNLWYVAQWYEWLRVNLPMILIGILAIIGIIAICGMAAEGGIKHSKGE